MRVLSEKELYVWGEVQKALLEPGWGKVYDGRDAPEQQAIIQEATQKRKDAFPLVCKWLEDRFIHAGQQPPTDYKLIGSAAIEKSLPTSDMDVWIQISSLEEQHMFVKKEIFSDLQKYGTQTFNFRVDVMTNYTGIIDGINPIFIRAYNIRKSLEQEVN